MRALAPLAAFALLLAPACLECRSHDECGRHHLCVPDGRIKVCVRGCESPAQCDDDEVCLQSSCPTCSDCGPCADGQCGNRFRCTSDHHCASTMYPGTCPNGLAGTWVCGAGATCTLLCER